MEKLEGGGCESGGDLQDMVRQAIEDVVREQIGGGADSDGGCAANGSASANEGAASSGGKSTFDRIQDMAMDNVEEESKKENKAECRGSSGGKGDNWLVALAKAMSTIQSSHLNKMLDAQKDMQDNVGEDEASREKFIEAQGKFQAESKLFGMASEATSTALKTIGEGLSSIARKQ
jgi:recombinational DNA repair protein RecT